MAAGNETKLTPSEVRNIAKNHRAGAQEIRGDLKNVEAEVRVAQGANKGAMVNKLVQVHQQWDTHTNKIVVKLEEMAQTLDRAATALESQDQDNAGGITT